MAHENDVPGRDVEHYGRWGIAPSISFGLGTDTSWTLSYFHQKDDNVPQYGVPTFKGDVLPGVDDSKYYGYRNFDTQEITGDSLTSVIQHQFDGNSSLRNLTRAQRVKQFTLVDPPQGTFCLPSGLQPTGASCTLNPDTFLEIVVPPGFYMPSGPRGNIRDTTNKLLYNQTDFTSDFNTGKIEHTFVAGVSFSHETYSLDGFSQFRNEDGTNPYAAPGHFPFTPIGEPDSYFTGADHRTLTSKQNGDLDNEALYAFDNLKFNEYWSLNLGARYEHNDATSKSYIVKTFTAPTVANPDPDNSDIGRITGVNPESENSADLFSYRAGLVFKPVENASLYAAFSNSKTPSAATVNGACTATSTTGTANCDVDPESAKNYEIGAKWDTFDGRLSLTGSIFRNERTNYRVADPGNPDNPSGFQTLDGRARVDGLLLSAIGQLMPNWYVYANYSHLDSKVLQGASDFVALAGRRLHEGRSAAVDAGKFLQLLDDVRHLACMAGRLRCHVCRQVQREPAFGDESGRSAQHGRQLLGQPVHGCVQRQSQSAPSAQPQQYFRRGIPHARSHIGRCRMGNAGRRALGGADRDLHVLTCCSTSPACSMRAKLRTSVRDSQRHAGSMGAQLLARSRHRSSTTDSLSKPIRSRSSSARSYAMRSREA